MTSSQAKNPDDRKAEDDTEVDDARADSRATGGDPDDADTNVASTTSPTDTDEYVGRIAGDDVGYAGETGAEARTEADRS